MNHRLVKNLKNNGDNSEIHPETQESDGEVPFEEESTDRSYVYQFKWVSNYLNFDHICFTF